MLELWAHLNGVAPDNAFIEPFNGRLREECLDQHEFADLDAASGDAGSLADRLQ